MGCEYIRLCWNSFCSFAVRGKILNRKGNQVLIDLGKRDGISLDSRFIVAKKDEVKNSDTGIGLVLLEEMYLGEIELVEIGEDVSLGNFVQKGFYDRMNPNDEIFLVSKDDDNDSPSEVMSQNEMKSPEFLQMLNSIK